MKFAKKLLALLMALALMATMSVCALAEGEGDPEAPETPAKMTVKCVDTEGATIRDQEGDYLDLSKDVTVDDNYARPEIEGYKYQKTTLDGEELKTLTVSHDEENNPVINAVVGENTEKTLTGNETILFVYEKHEHSFDEGKVTKEPTCTEAGEKTYTCECGETKTEEIPALGHDYDEGKVTKKATCTEAGEKTYTCKNDSSHTKTEEIPALGHDYDEGKVTTEPTCEKAGVKTYTCKNDSSHTKTEEIPALGHDYDEGKVTKEATCKEAGVKTYTCKRDSSHTKTEEIKKVDHQYEHGRCKFCNAINPKFTPVFSDATNGHANWGSNYYCRSNAARKDFQKVLVDGKEISTENYFLWEDKGDTGITLKGDYIKTLKAGSHEVSIVSVTGTATRTISVSDKPKTGDEGAGVWAGLLVLSTLGFGAVLLTAKKRFGTR